MNHSKQQQLNRRHEEQDALHQIWSTLDDVEESLFAELYTTTTTEHDYHDRAHGILHRDGTLTVETNFDDRDTYDGFSRIELDIDPNLTETDFKTIVEEQLDELEWYLSEEIMDIPHR